MSEASVSTSVSAELAPQFDDPQQQRLAAELGMWAFLATEVLFFGAMFTSFAIYRLAQHEGFELGRLQMHVLLGTINTAVLLTSSYTMVRAVHAAEHSDTGALRRWLLWTAVQAVAFLVIKGMEYAEHVQHGLLPGSGFHAQAGHDEPGLQMFMFHYFTMTGLHALHVAIGIGLLAGLYVLAGRGRFHRDYYTPVDMIGLYWHFVDLVWIFLFPVLYLL